MRARRLAISLAVSAACCTNVMALDIGTWEVSLQRLVSAFAVTTKQTSVLADHDDAAKAQARSATVSTIATQDNQLRTARAKEEYSPETGTGYSVCNVALGLADERNSNTSAKQTADAYRQSDSDWLLKGGDGADRIGASLDLRRTFYCTQEQKNATGWCKGEAGGYGAGDSDAAPFLLNRNYGPEEVATSADYLDTIAPLPTINPSAATAEEQTALIVARRNAALLTGARAGLVKIILAGQGGDKQSGDTR